MREAWFYHLLILGKGSMRIRLIFAALFGVSALLWAEDTRSKVEKHPAFDRLKTLAGKWDGTEEKSGKSVPSNARFQIISDGSTIMGWLNEGMADEMATVFHMDGKQVMATHYCSAHNQPRLVLDWGGDPHKLTFKFKDGTNIGPNDGHMQAVTFTLIDSDHHTEDWVYLDKGKEYNAHFKFERKR